MDRQDGLQFTLSILLKSLKMRKLICFSYARGRLSDQVVLKNLITQFNDLQLSRHAEIWWDEAIPVGHEWHREIHDKFSSADVYIVLASAAYECSEYILQFEWPIIEKRTRTHEAKLFWVPIDRQASEFRHPVHLSRFQTIAGLLVPWEQASNRERHEYTRALAAEVALALNLPDTRAPAVHTDNPRKIEADYLAALRMQCDAFPKADRYLPMKRLYVRLKADERPPEELRASKEVLAEEIALEMQSGEDSPAEIIAKHVKKI
jgi:hypothetical protein